MEDKCLVDWRCQTHNGMLAIVSGKVNKFKDLLESGLLLLDYS